VLLNFYFHRRVQYVARRFKHTANYVAIVGGVLIGLMDRIVRVAVIRSPMIMNPIQMQCVQYVHRVKMI
jgi:hypothetical protein